MEWITKQRCYRKPAQGTDVSITVVKNPKVNYGKRTTFAFRNNCHKKITKNGYVCIALIGSKMYFREADEKEGYHIYKRCKNAKYEAAYRTAVTIDLSGFIGDYDLLFDKETGYWYIDAELKKM